MTKPYYVVEFSATACLFEIRVNDVPVMILELPGQASSMAPVNFAILKSGKQSISARILPLPGQAFISPSAALSYQLRLYDTRLGFDLKENLNSYQFPKIDEKEQKTVLQNLETFDAEVPYQLSGWTNGLNLNDVEGVREKLVSAYQKIARAIRNKNYELFRQMLTNREEIMSTSMYLNPGQPGKRIDNLIRDFENGFELIPFAGDLTIQYYGGGKLASLRRINGDHAICAQNLEKDEELLLDLAFYIPEGKTEFECI